MLTCVHTLMLPCVHAPMHAAEGLDPLSRVPSVAQHRLMAWPDAVRAVHRPQSLMELGQAQTSLAFK